MSVNVVIISSNYLKVCESQPLTAIGNTLQVHFRFYL